MPRVAASSKSKVLAAAKTLVLEVAAATVDREAEPQGRQLSVKRTATLWSLARQAVAVVADATYMVALTTTQLAAQVVAQSSSKLMECSH